MLQRGGCTDIHYVETGDGWKLALLHYADINSPVSKNFPVLMCHGIGANRLIFDMMEHISLARYLNQKGYDVWIVELRGSNLSFHSRYNLDGNARVWDFDHLVTQDVPKAIEYVLEKTNSKQLHWIGHSMGGMLHLAYLSRGVQQMSQIRTGITLGSTLKHLGSRSGFDQLARLLKLKKYIPAWLVIPNGTFNTLISPFLGYISTPLETFQVNPPNMDPTITKMLFRFGFHRIPAQLLLQLSSSIVGEKGATDRTGNIAYLDQLEELIKKSPKSAPNLMLIAGEKDHQCPIMAAENSYNKLSAVWPNGKLELKCYGRNYGHLESYGHNDLLIGKNVKTEVFPDIESWISKGDML